MRNQPCGVRAPALGACLLLALAACGSSNNRPPNVGTGDDLVIAVPPGTFGIRRVDIVGIPPDERTDADLADPNPTPLPNGMMPPHLDASLRIEADRVTHLDGLDIGAILASDDPDTSIRSYRNVIDAQNLTFDLDLLEADGAVRHVQLALTKSSADLLVGALRFDTIAAKTGIRATGTYRIELDRRADPLDD